MYLTRVKSGKTTYLYLARYEGKRENSSRRDRYIASLGDIAKLDINLKIWSNFPETFPDQLRDLGVTVECIRKMLQKKAN